MTQRQTAKQDGCRNPDLVHAGVCSARSHALGLVLAVAGLGAAGVAQAQVGSACGPLENRYGPFDYRVVRGEALKMVEDYHFTPSVEQLTSGHTSSIGADLNYTLRAYPNHHRALLAMLNLGIKLKADIPLGAVYSVECFFIRALTFRPDDVVARMLYAKFLATKERKPEALKQLESTAFYAENNGFTHYNMGMMYLDLGEPQSALKMAHRAEALGFTRPELKQRLQAAGKWQEPPGTPGEAPASAPAKG